MRFASLSVCGVLAITACAPVYKPPIDEFTKSFATAKEIIADRAQAMNGVKRRKVLEEIFYTEEDPQSIDETKLGNFVTAVCASSDYLSKQQEALVTLGVYNSVLEISNKVPKQDISSLLKSIGANWKDPRALTPADGHAPPTLRCTVEVENLIKMPRDKVPEFPFLGIVPLLALAEKTLEAAEKATVFALGIVDDQVRGRRIRKYVAESASQVDEDLKTLNRPDSTAHDLCQYFKFRPPCRGEKDGKGEAITYSRLDGVTIAQKWAALRKPWHLFLAIYSTKAAYIETKEAKEAAAEKDKRKVVIDPAPYLYLLDKQQDELTEALRDYRTLASTSGAGDVARSMADANETLVRLANGSITPAEAWAVLLDYGKRIKDVADSVKTLADTKGTFEKKIEEIQKADQSGTK